VAVHFWKGPNLMKIRQRGSTPQRGGHRPCHSRAGKRDTVTRNAPSFRGITCPWAGQT
jgi:hypothetical protein